MKKRIFIICTILLNLSFYIFYGINVAPHIRDFTFILFAISLVCFFVFLFTCCLFIKRFFNFLYAKIVPPKGEKKIISGRGFWVLKHVPKERSIKALTIGNICLGIITTILSTLSFIIVI